MNRILKVMPSTRVPSTSCVESALTYNSRSAHREILYISFNPESTRCESCSINGRACLTKHGRETNAQIDDSNLKAALQSIKDLKVSDEQNALAHARALEAQQLHFDTNRASEARAHAKELQNEKAAHELELTRLKILIDAHVKSLSEMYAVPI